MQIRLPLDHRASQPGRRVRAAWLGALALILLSAPASANPVLVNLDGYLIPILRPGSSQPSGDGPLQLAQEFPDTRPSWAASYIRNFPYSGGHRVTVSTPTRFPRNCSIDRCDHSRCGVWDKATIHCRASEGFPIWNLKHEDCPLIGTASRRVNRTHVRPRLLNGMRPFGPDQVGRTGYCVGNSCLPAIYLNFKILVNDWMAGHTGPENKCSYTLHSLYQNGPNYRQVYPAEVTPDGFGLIPASSDIWNNKQWFLSLRNGWRFGGRGPRSATLQREYFQNVEPPQWNGDAPRCPAGHSCEKLVGTPRALIAKRGGEVTVLISGVGSGVSLTRDARDIVQDIGNLKLGGKNNPTVTAVKNWLARNNGFGHATIIGHSLGALDATVLHWAGAAKHTILYSPPTPISGNSIKPWAGRTIEAYCGKNDWVCNGLGGITGQRRALGAKIQEINTGVVSTHHEDKYCFVTKKPCIR